MNIVVKLCCLRNNKEINSIRDQDRNTIIGFTTQHMREMQSEQYSNSEHWRDTEEL